MGRYLTKAPNDHRHYSAERGPNGRALCRWCAAEVPYGRRSWCSESCAREFRIRSSSSSARFWVDRRDKGVCAMCGLDCRRLRRLLGRLSCRQGAVPLGLYLEKEWAAKVYSKRKTWYGRLIGLLVLSGFDTDRSLWDADHTIPVVRGGGGMDGGLDNLRTLCQPCHKAETAKLAAERATERKATKP